MAGYMPPGFPFIPPPPPRSTWYPPPPSTWHRPPERSDNNTDGGLVAGIAISVCVFFLVLAFFSSLCRRYGNSRVNAAADAARAAAALAVRPQAPPRPELAWDNEEQLLHRHHSDRNVGHTRPASPTAGLPSFTYNRAVRHNVTGSGDEATTCSVCLSGFQEGETVRLLPVCLHLYHVECIDPWLEAHSTCPLCRSGTEDPMMHGSNMLPPV